MDLDPAIRNSGQAVPMPRIKLIPERTSDGTVVFRAEVRRPGDWLRRLFRRLAPAA